MRRARRITLAAVLAALLVPSVAAAQGSGDYASFGPSSPNSAAAYNLAVGHIGAQPCLGHVTITWYPLGATNSPLVAIGPATGYPAYGTIGNPCIILFNYDTIWVWANYNPSRGFPQEPFCGAMYNAVAALSGLPQVTSHAPSFCAVNGGNPPFR